MDAIRDRNLLFGVLAVQLRGVTPAQLVEVSAAWATEPGVPVAQRLVEKGVITPDDRVLLEKLVDDAIRVHGGDSQAVVELFGGGKELEKAFLSGFDTGPFGGPDTPPMGGPTFFTGRGTEISGVNESPGRYTLISHHARGGMGRVLVVHDEFLGRNIALKELLPPSEMERPGQKSTPVRQSAAVVARFLQEARITSQLEHPSIVPVYELGRRWDGSLYYTMRLVRGRTFAAALHDCEGLDGRLRLLTSFISLCQAIAYAHSRGVIHRDIKPSNIMLGTFGEVVVLDWGLAKARDSEDASREDIRDTLHFLDVNDEEALLKTAYGRALGTPHYMPVEQAEGRIDAIDERSDVYSLGAVLYEILTGTRPYSGKSTQEIIEKVIRERHAPVLEKAPDVPPELAVICEKALQKEQSQRYQSAAELAEDVRRFIDGSLVRAYRYTLRQVAAHYYSKHRLRVNTALACAAVLIILGIGSYVSIMQARDRECAQRLVAERKTYQSQIQLAQAYLNGHEPARAGETLWATAEKERGWEWGYLLNRANPEVYTIETPDSELYCAVFSPDGARIGTNTHPAPPALYEADTGKKLADLEGEPARYTHTAFSPDGTRYMGIAADGTVNVWETATGKRTHHLAQRAMGYSAVFDHSGDMLYAGYGDKKVRAFDLKNGTVACELDVNRAPVSDLSMVPGRDRLLITAGTDTTQAWDLATRTLAFAVPGAQPAASPDGAHMANIQGSDAVLWDAQTGAELRRFKGHEMAPYSLCFNRDGSRLLSASQDGKVILWDTATANPVQKYEAPNAVPVLQAFFLANESAVMAYTADHSGLVFSGTSPFPLHGFQGKGKYGQCAAAQPNGTLVLMIPAGERLVQAINPLAPTGVESIVADATSMPDTYNEIAAAGSGNLVAVSASRSGMVRLVDPRAGKRPTAYTAAFGAPPARAALSDDGGRLALVADHFVPVAVHDPAGSPSWAAFTGHTTQVTALALRADGRQAASGDASGAIFLWDADSAQPDRALPVQGGALTVLQFSRDGSRLLSAAQDGSVVLWATDTGAPLLTLPKQSRPMVAAALNSDGTRILTVTTAGEAQLWDTATKALTGSARVGASHENSTFQGYGIEARFWPGDQMSLIGLPFGAQKLWDAATWVPMVFLNEKERVQAVNNGRSLAVVDRNGTVRVEDIPENGEALSPETYAKYQRRWAARSALAVETASPKTHVFVSREDLARALEDLARLEARTLGTGTVLLEATGTVRTQTLAAMGMHAGDAVCALNGITFVDPAAARGALASAARQLAGQPRSSLPITLFRDGQAVEHVYWAMPLVREERSVTLTREEALVLVQEELDELWTSRCMASDDAWIYTSVSLNAVISGKAQLADGVMLAGTEGRPFESMDGAEEAQIGRAHV